MREPPTRRVIGPQLSADSRVLNFSDQIAAFAKNTKSTLNEAHKSITIKMFSAIVMETPVLTGIARGNWQTSMDSVKGSTLHRPDPSGALALAEIEATVEADTDKIAFMANNLEYIIPLEYGWSKKAPEGMVRINVVRFQGIVAETARELNGGPK